MGQQTNKIQKRARRKRYIQRVKDRIKETVKKARGTSAAKKK